MTPEQKKRLATAKLLDEELRLATIMADEWAWRRDRLRDVTATPEWTAEQLETIEAIHSAHRKVRRKLDKLQDARDPDESDVTSDD